MANFSEPNKHESAKEGTQVKTSTAKDKHQKTLCFRS
jgi:hypothetical protein